MSVVIDPCAGTAPEAWAAKGLVRITEFDDSPVWDAMLVEARAYEPFATVRRFDGLASYRDGSLASSQRCRAHVGGEVIRRFATSRALVEAVRAATSMKGLVPARFGYKYYAAGDYMGIHRDAVRCDVTFTFGVTPNLGSMKWAPQLRGASNEEILRLAEREGLFPSVGEPVAVPSGTLQGFDGYNIPHWREPFEHDFGILGTICFFDL